MTRTEQKTLLDRLHGGYVHQRRVGVLSQMLAELLPRDARVLDVGCGDGLLAALILQRRPDLQIDGIDVLVRDRTHIPVQAFDGVHVPLAEQSVDAVMFVDVLHHTPDPMVLLREAARVARRAVVIKDHRRNGLLAQATLRFMDDVGNARHGVALPYNYWSEQHWRQAFDELGLRVESWTAKVPLYPTPASWVFGRRLHFVARLGRGVVPDRTG